MEQSLQILSRRAPLADECPAGAPISIEALQVAYDYTYNREVLQIFGKNSADAPLRSVYFDLICLDDAGDRLGVLTGGCVRALSTAPGEALGENAVAVIPYAGTCRVEFALQKVVLADERVWRSGDAPIAPAVSEPASVIAELPESNPREESAEPPAIRLSEQPVQEEPAPIPAEWLNPPATPEGYRAAAEGLTSLNDPAHSYLIKKFTALAVQAEKKAAEEARMAEAQRIAAERAATYAALLGRTAESADELEALAAEWKALGNYKDASRRGDEALKKSKSIRTSEKRLAAKRAEEAKQAAEAAAILRRRRTKIALTWSGIAATVLAVTLLILFVLIPALDRAGYAQIDRLVEEGKYTEALSRLEQMGDDTRADQLREDLCGNKDGLFLSAESYPCYKIQDGVLSFDSTKYSFTGKTLTIPDYFDDQKVTALSDACFTGLDSVEEFVLPRSVTSVGKNAFADCTKLTKFTAPGLIELGDEVFRGCTALTEITLSETVTSLGAGLFQGCTALRKVTLPEGIRKLPDYLFLNCTALETVNIPSSVVELGTETFAYCIRLTTITLPDRLTTLGNNTFLSCTGITRIVLPDSVTVIGDKTFAACTKLTEIRLSSQLAVLPARTFEGCTALRTATLPSALTKVGYAAFSGCTALSTVHYPGTAQAYAAIELQKGNEPLAALTPVFGNAA